MIKTILIIFGSIFGISVLMVLLFLIYLLIGDFLDKRRE